MNNLRRRSMSGSSVSGIEPSQAEALDVAFYNSTSDSIVIRKQDDWQDDETPIGIVVVPGTHNRYEDGSCGVMSLVGMDYQNPTTGAPVTDASQTDAVNMHFGFYQATIGCSIFNSGYSFPPRTSNTYIPCQTNSSSTACSIVGGGYTKQWPYAGTLTNPTDEPSTLIDNNGGYVTATKGWVACDFNGIRNTAAMYVKTRTSKQWTNATVSSDYSGTRDTVVAACAGRFKTVGTQSFLDIYKGITTNDLSYGTPSSTRENKGYWYVPSVGELCYLPRYRFEINKIILALNIKYGNVGILLHIEGGFYWSSDSASSNNTWNVIMSTIISDYPNLESRDKSYSGHVRAFLRL